MGWQQDRLVTKKLQQCNWAQACEGALDTAHFSFLHMSVGDGMKVVISCGAVLPSWPDADTAKAALIGESERVK